MKSKKTFFSYNEAGTAQVTSYTSNGNNDTE